ncbi:hypothetical protein FE257_006307 [Aspergillus nanangensis]|uniref:Transcription factor IIIC 90kDa subunit N-terminal domain-containing protein n=1 Tax=Aspergillus nanangensis TaxID=2582783 RepID=A0AAD4CP84_ASPNN|nr:hypothetical protein FE257_006307 [Aspergillus nanangensis]
MLSPVQLHVFPSCYSSLSCSADGELALAAGEYVHVITPKGPSKENTSSAPTATSSNWQITRFRANVFTNKEWPTILPQDRENFSIGAEQSNSTVAGLAWSPPGLAKHRRCILAVLTTNLILSFYEAVGPQAKWTRVAVVNEALRSYFGPLISTSSLSMRKSHIRSFAWSPPLLVPSSEETTTRAEHRWGIPLLTVTNDDNDVIFLRAQRSIGSARNSNPYSIEVLSLTPLHDPVGNNRVAHSSIFASAVKTRLKSLSISYGPWLFQESGEGDWAAVSNVAVVYGDKLKIIKQSVKLCLDMEDVNVQPKCEMSSETTLCSHDINNHNFTGPLQWIYLDGSAEVHLCAGIRAGMIVVTASCAAYKASAIKPEHIKVQEWPFYNEPEENSQDERSRHWESIGGCLTFQTTQNAHQLSSPPWKSQVDEICERFDLDHDLGGLVSARVWGLASYRGLVMAAVTRHPGDRIEYRTSLEDLTAIVFSGANSQCDEPGSFPTTPEPNRSPDAVHAKRKALLGYVLDAKRSKYDARPWSQKILYAAACCAVVESHEDTLLWLARKAFEWLSSSTGLDLTDEISKCSAPGSTIDAKSETQLSGPGLEVFEKCEVCSSGISWYSAHEGQCAEGHLFVRCGLSLLCLQEPGLSKFCSVCDTEYYSEDVIDSSYGVEFQHSYLSLSDIFDTCVYCGGKFRS